MTSSPSTSETSVLSPLTVDKTDTISELFNRDPTDWSDADVDRMIAHYRQERVKFQNKPAKAAAQPKIAKEDLQGLSGTDLLSTLGL